MNVTQAFQNLINRPTPSALAVTLGVSILLLLIACSLLLSGRRKWLSVGIGGFGLLLTLFVLLVVDQQTVSSRESESVLVTRPRYQERTRTLARSAMIGLPGVVVLVALVAWASARRRLRRSVPGLVKAGRMHLFLKEFEPALAEFGRAIRISPYLADAYCGRGTAYEGLGEVERALAEYSRAIECDPRLAVAFIRRARIRTEAGDLDGALADLGRVMDLQPTDPELYLSRGICYLKKGLTIEAAADFQRVLKLTNHTDFAEPAKDFLRRLGILSADTPSLPVPPPPQPNGAPESSVMPEPKTEDYIL
jgi:tetratricopeptide (TPR) repeat protein